MRDWDDDEFELDIPSFRTEEEILEILRSGDDELRLEVLDEVGEVEDEVALELLRLVGSEEPVEIRAAAAIALGPTLEACELELDDGELATGEYGAPLTQGAYDQVVDGLERVYRDSTVPSLARRRALEAAVRSPKPWQAAAIRAAWASRDLEWRVTAVFCMGEYDGIDFSAEVRAALAADEVALRSEGLIAAGRLELAEAVDLAMTTAEDEQAPRELRFAAMSALAFSGSAAAEPVLGRLAEHRDAELAVAAETALDELLLRRRIDEFDEDAYDEE